MRTARPALILSTLLAACGSPPAAPPPVVETEGPEAQILRVGSLWESRQGGKTFRTAPDPISVVEIEQLSSLRLVRGRREAKEELSLREVFTLRAGGSVTCVSRTDLLVTLKYGLKSGEPALEITRPATDVPRECDGAAPVEAVADVGSGSARFVLRGDQLVAFAPALEKRVYLPIE